MLTGLSDYLLSLPERVVRSLSAVTGGLLHELGDVAVPAAVRRTRLYHNLVESTLRFLIEQVGEVEGIYPAQGKLAEDFAIRRTAGNGIELIGVLTFRASPVWVMAVLADISGAGRHVIREVAESLKREGLLEPSRNFDSVDQILDGLEKSAGRVAEAFNTPPLDVESLREEWAAIRQEVRNIPPKQRPSPEVVRGNWEALKTEAARQNRSVFEMSSLMALAAVNRLPENLRRLGRSAQVAARRTGELFAGALLDHYSNALREIHETGFLAYWIREFRPYLRAAAAQFSPFRTTLTQRFLSGRRRGPAAGEP